MAKKPDAFDAYEKGKEDREDAKPASFMDIVTLGFGSGNYKPPSDPDLKDAYKRGWDGKK